MAQIVAKSRSTGVIYFGGVPKTFLQMSETTAGINAAVEDTNTQSRS